MKRLVVAACAAALLAGFALLPSSRTEADLENGAWSNWLVLLASNDPPGSQVVTAAALARPKTSEVTISYAGFPEPAKQAFEHAATILEQQVTSDFEVYVSAAWIPLGTEVLAYVRTRLYTRDAENTNLPYADVLYPAALAGAFRGERLDELPDIEIQVNSEAPWYTGTGGDVPNEQWDLITVALHEMLQAYGIWTQLYPYVDEQTPSVFDLFVVGPDGTPIYEHDPLTFYLELTGGELSFSGPSARVAAGGEAPRLYAPWPWDSRSSVAHLSEYYANADPDAGMAPYLYDGWSFHDPGPITLAMLKDIGWNISGLGTATRLTIKTHEPTMVQLNTPFPASIEVVAQDPVGAAVGHVDSVVVTLEPWGRWTSTPGWTCIGGIHQELQGGRATFNGCQATGGWSVMYLKATAADLAPGMHHVYRLVDELYTSWAPGLRQSH